MRKRLVKLHFPGIILLAVLTIVSSCERKESTNCEPDSYEPNNSLDSSYELNSVEENSASFTARISSEDDIDFYSITAAEGSHMGLPGTPQYFKMTFQLNNPSGKDYDLYIYNAEGSIADQSTNRGDEEESIDATWEGTVGFDDSYTFGVEVRPYSGDWSCEDYTLSVTMSYSSSPW
jgi:hypothetical protein